MKKKRYVLRSMLRSMLRGDRGYFLFLTIILITAAIFAKITKICSIENMFKYIYAIGFAVFIIVFIIGNYFIIKEVILKRRLAHRLKHGLCPFCGYDLRASKLVCPECGKSTEEWDRQIIRKPIEEPKQKKLEQTKIDWEKIKQGRK